MYIAAVFHNVLATYYLNRSTEASPYQIEKLKQRRIYIDTNVLYSFMVPASPFHEVVSYVLDRLKKIGVSVKLLPLTLNEYEHSLKIVEDEYKNDRPSPFLVRWNPWLYQEYRLNPAKYLKSMAVCRQTYSLCKGTQVTEKNFDELDRGLTERGLALERVYRIYSESEVQELWISLRNAMASSRWDLYQYWEFIYDQAGKSDEVIRHDVSCVQNLHEKAQESGADELGPKVLFVTLDSKNVPPQISWTLN